MKRKFFVATEEEIKKGDVSDVYFERGVKILKSKGINKRVKGEVRATNFPHNWPWAIFAGLEEALNLLSGIKVDIEALNEGEVFFPEEPVFTVEGYYLDFAIYETSLLGLLCQASGIATKAARCKKAAQERKVYSFGARRMHPAIAPMIERSAFIGGCDGVAAIESARLIGEKPIGTMSHSLILTFGSEYEAFKAFDEVLDPSIKRVALIDTFQDEKFGAITAVEALGKNLFAVRLDTPSSRRGNFLKILEEVRWELDLRGFKNVQIFVSGGIDEEKISKLNPFVDAYGIGTAISNAPVIDFSFDLVEVEGKAIAKRGKMSGSKQVWRCQNCFKDLILPIKETPNKCSCGETMKPLLEKMVKKGKRIKPIKTPQEIREKVLFQIKSLPEV